LLGAASISILARQYDSGTRRLPALAGHRPRVTSLYCWIEHYPATE
jgi:hypothetical protein